MADLASPVAESGRRPFMSGPLAGEINGIELTIGVSGCIFVLNQAARKFKTVEKNRIAAFFYYFFVI